MMIDTFFLTLTVPHYLNPSFRRTPESGYSFFLNKIPAFVGMTDVLRGVGGIPICGHVGLTDQVKVRSSN
jgi:hypothetical protein